MEDDAKPETNPYTPPTATSESTAAPPRLPRLLREILQALTTIVGIMVGWVVIGAGLMERNRVTLLIGCFIIALSCVVGLRAGRHWKRARYRS